MANSNPPSDRVYYLFALKIVGDFGASIAVPVVILALLGQHFDNQFHTAPKLLILGFVLAFIASAKIIYRKAKIYGREYQNLGKK